MNKTEESPYKGYDVLAKWETPSFDDLSRSVLARRLWEEPQRHFFTPERLSLLEAVIRHLGPQLPELPPSLIALWIDDRLHRNLDEGFRHEAEPPLREQWLMGLLALNDEAQRLYHARFVDLEDGAQESILRAVHSGEVDPSLWSGLNPSAFFTGTLLKAIAGLCYAHPAAWNDMGFGGPASPRGYVRLGFDARDPWEAKERR